MRFWLGPYVWSPTHAEGVWLPPAGSLGGIDLRNETQCGTPVVPLGVALFGTANAMNLGAGYDNLGTDPDVVLTAAQKTGWRTKLLLPQAPAALTLRDLLWETLTIQADPTGVDRCRPLVPLVQGAGWECWLAGARLRRQPFDAGRPEWAPVVDQLRREYRRIRQACLNGTMPPEHYRKVCGYWVRKYRLDYRAFQPGDLPDEPDLPPSTTITESFNKADSDTLGPDLTWTETEGDQDVVSNTCEFQNNAANDARAESDLSSADHYCQVTRPNGSGSDTSYAGPCTRFAAAATTCYVLADYLSVFQMYKLVAGTLTALGAGVAITRADNDTYKLTNNGTTLTSRQNGVDKETITDSAIAGNLRCGVKGFWGGGGAAKARVDLFEGADLAAAVSLAFPARGSTRAMVRR